MLKEQMVIGMSLVAGISTGLGALPVLIKKDLEQSLLDVGLGFSAGIMLVAAFLSLLVPAMEISKQLLGPLFGIWPVVLGLMVGYFLILKLHNKLPHEHIFKGIDITFAKEYKKVTLIILAICLHNIPEGLAVGVGFGTEDLSNGISLAIGIAIQNMPEGLVVALGLLSIGQSKKRAVLLAFLSGLVEPVAALIGYLFSQITLFSLPFSLSFAGGAMLFVVCQEVFPELFKEGHEVNSTKGVICGIALMTAIQFWLS